MKKIAILGNQEVTSLIIQYLNDYNINISLTPFVPFSYF